MPSGTELRQGFRAGLPIALGYLPIAITYGLLARQAGLSALEATGMSLWVYAGASQFTALEMLGSGIAAGPIALENRPFGLRHHR